MKPLGKAQARPAETGGAIGSAVVLIGAGLGLDIQLVAGLGIIAGLVPSAVTWFVSRRARG